MRTKIDDKLLKTIIKEYNSNIHMSVVSLAEKYNVNHNTLYKHMNKQGVKLYKMGLNAKWDAQSKNKWTKITPKLLDKVIKELNRNKNTNINLLAKKYKCKSGNLYRKLAEMGIHTREKDKPEKRIPVKILKVIVNKFNVERATLTQLSKEFNYTKAFLYKEMKRVGVAFLDKKDKITNERSRMNYRKENINKLLKAQDFACSICDAEINEKTAKLDHCHRNLTIRSLLCNNCNIGIGMFREDPNIMKKAIKYINLHKTK